jgi:hypothetical protein
MRPAAAAAFALLAALQTSSGQAAGQIAEEVARLSEGVVRFSYDTRPEVEICEEGIRMGEQRMWWRSRGWDDEPTSCRTGFAEVELEVRDGVVLDVEVMRRVGDRTGAAVDVGMVPAPVAARYLLSLARAGASGRGAREAVLPAMLADVEEVWRDLADIARDTAVGGSVRKSALFWLGQEAADAATSGIAEVARDEDEDQDIRDAAIFALSQRPPDEGIPVLMDLARTGDQSDTRRTAMFWLAQSQDERVIEFFEEILLGRIR